jgi:hypothetical protein
MSTKKKEKQFYPTRELPPIVNICAAVTVAPQFPTHAGTAVGCIASQNHGS